MKDPVSVFGCWRGFHLSGFAGQRNQEKPGQEDALPIAALLARIRKLIPEHDDRHYDEIVRSFGNGALRAPAVPMSDRELAYAIADFLEDAPSAQAVGSLDRRIDPSSPL
jgi:hypothetical protein